MQIAVIEFWNVYKLNLIYSFISRIVYKSNQITPNKSSNYLYFCLIFHPEVISDTFPSKQCHLSCNLSCTSTWTNSFTASIRKTSRRVYSTAESPSPTSVSRKISSTISISPSKSTTPMSKKYSCISRGGANRLQSTSILAISMRSYLPKIRILMFTKYSWRKKKKPSKKGSRPSWKLWKRNLKTKRKPVWLRPNWLSYSITSISTSAVFTLDTSLSLRNKAVKGSVLVSKSTTLPPTMSTSTAKSSFLIIKNQQTKSSSLSSRYSLSACM